MNYKFLKERCNVRLKSMELNKNNRMFKRFRFSSWRILSVVITIFLSVVLGSCTISYKFNGSVVDYAKTKTISISDFPNVAELVYPPLSQEFAESLRDAYTKQTRLQLQKKGGDMHLEGEIVGYQLTPMAISSDGYSSQTKLTLTINVRFSNNKNPADDFEKKFSAYQTFDNTNSLTSVQDELVKTMITDIVDNIYNDTVGKW